MQTKRLILAVLLLGGTAGTSTALPEGGHSKAIDYRNSVMTVLKWNMSAMGAVFKGNKPYDRNEFKRHAMDLATAAHLDLLAGFPDGSDEGEDTDARMDIWMDWEGFEEKYAHLRETSKTLAETAAGNGGLKAIGPRFSAVGKACKACHDSFKD